MVPTLFLITGFPGVGKLTVARCLATLLEEQGQTGRVVDNPGINNPIVGLVQQDGISPLPEGVWDRVGEVASAVVRTVEEISPPHWNFIFTAYLDGITDTATVTRLAEVANNRGTTFVPVRLLCDPDENSLRIVSSERHRRMKSVDPDEPHRLASLGPPYDMGHRSQLTLDVTSLPPDEAARLILDHATVLS